IAKDNLAKLEVTDEEARAVTRKQAAIAASIDSGVVKPRVSETKRVVSAGRPAGDKILLRHVAVRDPMIHDCVAMTMLVPKDWRFEGRMDWCLDESVLVNPAWRITDAAQGFSMASLPFRHFTWSEGNVMPIGSRHLGMIVLPRIYDPADFVRRFWGKTLAKAVEHPPVRVRELPALAAQAAREWGAPADARGFALRYAWNEGGRDVEQEVIFALVYPRGTTTWFVTHCYTVEGRKGLIDERAGLTASTYASGEYTSEWKAGWRITYQLFLRRANAEIVEARKLAAALNEHRDEMAKIAAEMERDRAASNAARHRALSEALGGIETWTDPWQGRRINCLKATKKPGSIRTATSCCRIVAASTPTLRTRASKGLGSHRKKSTLCRDGSSISASATSPR
ncbi:MAG TPA: hypothetical protein PKE00_12985, partial [Planctomycetota bacterium]|nr:hypothetical protein [Planctomycetota bacterium]